MVTVAVPPAVVLPSARLSRSLLRQGSEFEAASKLHGLPLRVFFPLPTKLAPWGPMARPPREGGRGQELPVERARERAQCLRSWPLGCHKAGFLAAFHETKQDLA